MTVSKDLKKRSLDRQTMTGESFTTARNHVLGEQMEVLAPTASEPERREAVVLKVNQSSARVRIMGEADQVTFRSAEVNGFDPVVPGHLVTLLVVKRWLWHGDGYASGKVESARIDIPRLGLAPLSLHGGELEDVREHAEPFRGKDEYSKLLRKLTAKPRRSYELDELAWGAFPDDDPEDNPTCEAAELREAGREAEAHALLMDTLARDLRVLDSHAGLGSLAFDRSPKGALVHYEIGVRIGELSLPPGFDGLLAWKRLHNRAFLRCLHGYGLSLWRLRDFAAAKAVFERTLSFDPNDNQGVRFCWEDVRPWAVVGGDAGARKRRPGGGPSSGSPPAGVTQVAPTIESGLVRRSCIVVPVPAVSIRNVVRPLEAARSMRASAF